MYSYVRLRYITRKCSYYTITAITASPSIFLLEHVIELLNNINKVFANSSNESMQENVLYL